MLIMAGEVGGKYIEAGSSEHLFGICNGKKTGKIKMTEEKLEN